MQLAELAHTNEGLTEANTNMQKLLQKEGDVVGRTQQEYTRLRQQLHDTQARHKLLVDDAQAEAASVQRLRSELSELTQRLHTVTAELGVWACRCGVFVCMRAVAVCRGRETTAAAGPETKRSA